MFNMFFFSLIIALWKENKRKIRANISVHLEKIDLYDNRTGLVGSGVYEDFEPLALT
jgi:hypothetical protein